MRYETGEGQILTSLLGYMAISGAKFEFVELLSRDLAGARTLLVDRLGLPVQNERAGDFVEFRLGETRLCVDRAGKDPHGRETRAVVAFSVDDLDETATSLKQKGISFRRVSGEHGESLRVPLGPGLEVTFNPRE